MRLLLLLICLCAIALEAPAAEVPSDPADVCAIMPGETIPDGLVARRADGTEVDLSALLAEPTVLVVFRGGWCPYCNKHLQDLRGIEGDLAALGYRIVGLSPDRPGKAAELAEKLAASELTILSDGPMDVCRKLGLAFEVQPDLVEKYKGYGIDLEADSGYGHHQLPVPAALVLTDSVVRFAYVNPTYQVRVDGDVLLAAARAAMKPADTGR